MHHCMMHSSFCVAPLCGSEASHGCAHHFKTFPLHSRCFLVIFAAFNDHHEFHARLHSHDYDSSPCVSIAEQARDATCTFHTDFL